MSTDEEVYAAEDAWMECLRMAEHPDRDKVRYQGADYRPEGYVRFAELEDVASFVAKALAHVGRDPDEITVVRSRSVQKAHFDYANKKIHIPPRERGGAWAMNSAVVLHEIAHYLAGPIGHGQRFRLMFVRLLEDIGQHENARLLQACFVHHALPVLSEKATEATISRIGKVLRQAEAASTEAERATFLAKAQEMATRHSVTLATARAHQAKTEERAAPVARSYSVGERRQRGLTQRLSLLMGIGSANGVKFTIYGNNTGVTMYGFAEDIDLTIALYESILVQMVADCEFYLLSDEWRGEKVWSEKHYTRVPITKITARLAFYEAYQWRIARRLHEAVQFAKQEILASEEIVVSDETALVLRDKEIQVRDAYTRATRNITRSWRGGSSTRSSRSREAGDRAARSATIGATKALT